MQSLGIDIGSRTIKVVVLGDSGIEHGEVVEATSRPSRVATELLSRFSGLSAVATGYGRNLLEHHNIPTITEIKACALGTRTLCPAARTIIDIGGQDLKVITLDSNGKVAKFEMNDRCAAGTGKFLEIMAQKLDYPLQQFGPAALRGVQRLVISSLCTVFAESEVIGLLNRDEPPEDIALAVHYSAVKKIAGMHKRVASTGEPVHLVGGGALNSALQTLLSRELATSVVVPLNPQWVVALGASIIARQRAQEQACTVTPPRCAP
jgi:predicted CoA-substrate-specific enzyme activase